MTNPSEDKTKHTLWLREGDMRRLKERYSTLGASAVIRRIVSNFIDEKLDSVPTEEVQALIQDAEKESN